MWRTKIQSRLKIERFLRNLQVKQCRLAHIALGTGDARANDCESIRNASRVSPGEPVAPEHVTTGTCAFSTFQGRPKRESRGVSAAPCTHQQRKLETWGREGGWGKNETRRIQLYFPTLSVLLSPLQDRQTDRWNRAPEWNFLSIMTRTHTFRTGKQILSVYGVLAELDALQERCALDSPGN